MISQSAMLTASFLVWLVSSGFLVGLFSNCRSKWGELQAIDAVPFIFFGIVWLFCGHIIVRAAYLSGLLY